MSLSLRTGLSLRNCSDGSSSADAKDPDEGSRRGGEHEQASDYFFYLSFFKMGYLNMNKQGFFLNGIL